MASFDVNPLRTASSLFGDKLLGIYMGSFGAGKGLMYRYVGGRSVNESNRGLLLIIYLVINGVLDVSSRVGCLLLLPPPDTVNAVQ